MTNPHNPAYAALACCAVLLAACGGGGGHVDRDTAADSVPAAALASHENFTHYAATLREEDRREPLLLDGVLPPTSETAEPLPVAR